MEIGGEENLTSLSSGWQAAVKGRDVEAVPTGKVGSLRDGSEKQALFNCPGWKKSGLWQTCFCWGDILTMGTIRAEFHAQCKYIWLNLHGKCRDRGKANDVSECGRKVKGCWL